MAIKPEYDARAHCRPDNLVLDYLFLEASLFKMHPGSRDGAVLVVWGFTIERKPVFGCL
jgi:hypothetical protein